MSLDKQIIDAIAHLESLQEEHVDELVDSLDSVRETSPEDSLIGILIEGVKDQITANDIHYNVHRSKYNNLRSFKEKKEYYDDVLKIRELGYRLVQKELNEFLQNPKIKPMEAWFQIHHKDEIKRKGMKRFLVNELLFGNLK